MQGVNGPSGQASGQEPGVHSQVGFAFPNFEGFQRSNLPNPWEIPQHTVVPIATVPVN
jgi:hypothetical protein